jgi:uroporphyrinogen decarboxylase
MNQKMNHRERFTATVNRKPVDRPACWLGMPVNAALQGLYKHFKVHNLFDLKMAVDDDVWEVNVPYDNPPTNHVACAFDFSKLRTMDYEKRTLTDPGMFADCKDPAKVDDFPWPDPAAHMDQEKCRDAVESVPIEYPVLGTSGLRIFKTCLPLLAWNEHLS